MLRDLKPEDARPVQAWLRDHTTQHIAWWEKAYQIPSQSDPEALVLQDWQDLVKDREDPERRVQVFGEAPLGIIWGRVRMHAQLGVKVGTLSWIYVDPSSRGLGVADRLIEDLLAWFKTQGAQGKEVYVTASNTAAVRVYERHGFQVIDHRMLGPI